MKTKTFLKNSCFFCLIVGLTVISAVRAQQTAAKAEQTITPQTQPVEKTPEERMAEIYQAEFGNSELYTPFRAQMIYKTNLQYQEDMKNSQKALNMLSDTFHYSQEELEELARKMQTEDIFKHPLNTHDKDEMVQLIAQDTPAALSKIVSSAQINPVYFPSDEEDSGNALSVEDMIESSQNNVVSAQNETASEAPSQILSVQKLAAAKVKKRLGYRAYHINPDNFTYEKNN